MQSYVGTCRCIYVCKNQILQVKVYQLPVFEFTYNLAHLCQCGANTITWQWYPGSLTRIVTAARDFSMVKGIDLMLGAV